MKYTIWNINLKYFKFNLKYTIENEESYKVVITLNIMRVHTHTEYEANVNFSPYCASEVITLAVWCVAKCSKANADICMHVYKCVCSFYRNIIVWNTWVYSFVFFFSISNISSTSFWEVYAPGYFYGCWTAPFMNAV